MISFANKHLYHLYQPATYHSTFLKADGRTVLTIAGGTVRTTSFEGIAAIDDISVKNGASVELPCDDSLPGQCLILPVAGGALLTATAASIDNQPLVPGSLFVLSRIGALIFTNPFEAQAINLLLIRMNAPAQAAAVSLQACHLPLVAKNILVRPEHAALPVQTGVYDSRVKDSIVGLAGDSISICYVINGSFEVEDRLMEHRDALLLRESTEISFESLSDAAILLHLSLPLHNISAHQPGLKTIL